jgi:hypothetical protein
VLGGRDADADHERTARCGRSVNDTKQFECLVHPTLVRGGGVVRDTPFLITC